MNKKPSRGGKPAGNRSNSKDDNYFSSRAGGNGDRKKSGGGKSFGERKEGGAPYGKRAESEGGSSSRTYGKNDLSGGGSYGDKRSSGYSGRSTDGNRSSDGGSRKPYGTRATEGGSGKPYGTRPEFARPKEGGEKKYKPKGSYGKDGDSSRNERPYNREGGSDRPFGNSNRKDGEGDRKPFRERKETGDSRPFRERKETGNRKPYGDRKEEGDRKPFRDRKPDGESKPFRERKESDNNSNKPFGYGDRKESRGEKPFRDSADSDSRERKPYGDKPYRPRTEGDKRERPAYGDKPGRAATGGDNEAGGRPPKKRSDSPYTKKPYGDGRRGGGKPMEADNEHARDYDEEGSNSRKRRTIARANEGEAPEKDAAMTLNKYLAHSGVSSRRDAGNIIKEGKVTVNGTVELTPGYRVQPDDVIELDGKRMTPQRHHVYILLNKPKDVLTTSEDDRGRRTVLDLVASADVEGRMYPVGRLDRNTTGVLLITNDGDLAQKLTHPKYEVKKIYQVTLNKNVTKADFDKLLSGVELEDGVAAADKLSYLETKSEIGIEIHSGRNRIVRRLFEALDYEVVKLDRVMFAGFTKKNVGRGKWRFLDEREVILLKHFKNR